MKERRDLSLQSSALFSFLLRPEGRGNDAPNRHRPDAPPPSPWKPSPRQSAASLMETFPVLNSRDKTKQNKNAAQVSGGRTGRIRYWTAPPSPPPHQRVLFKEKCF